MTHPIAGQKWCNKIPGNYDATIVAVVGDHVWYKLTECAQFVSTIAAFMKNFTPPPEDHGIKVGQRYRGNGTKRFVTVIGVFPDGTIMAQSDGSISWFARPLENFKECYSPVTRRPRTLDDVKKMLAKVESPTLWVKYPDGGWFVSHRDINDTGIEMWNKQKALMSINPFVDNPVILGPEVEE